MGCCGNNNVGGASNRRHCGNNVAGASDFKVPVRSYIDGEDFCRAVNRCLRDDMVGGAEDRNHRCCCKHHRRRGWDFWY